MKTAKEILIIVDKQISESQCKISSPYLYKLEGKIWCYLRCHITDSTDGNILFFMINEMKSSIPTEFINYSKNSFLNGLASIEVLAIESERNNDK